MSVLIFGNGPLPLEPIFPVMAPGSRTWQMIRTAAAAMVEQGRASEPIIILGLDEQQRSGPETAGTTAQIKAGQSEIEVQYFPLPYNDFVNIPNELPPHVQLPGNVRAVIATGSVQPYSTAAGYASKHQIPLWVDVFGDPICETQSQAEIAAEGHAEEQATRMVHVWKLLVDGLLHGDRFSTLSQRQRYALLGQLGCAGRLNQYTAEASLVDSIPYGLFLEDFKAVTPAPQADDRFTVMWSGSFNTWMDVPTLTRGLTNALKSTPNMRLLVVGGKIPGYNEISYQQFLDGLRGAGVEGAVTLMDWQPLSAMQNLYTQVDIGISIDRYTYEAELGSRTRLVNFLASGVPVVSTVVTELSRELLDAGQLIRFDLGNAESLTDALVQAAQDRGNRLEKARAVIKHVYTAYNGNSLGEPLKAWLHNPMRAKDHDEGDTNKLLQHTQQLRASLGA